MSLSIKTIFVFALLTFSNYSEAQFPKFEIKDAIQKQDTNYIVYLTAVWCKPCMEVLKNVIDSFKNEKKYKLIIWFERSYLDDSPELMKRLKDKYGDSLFYFFPLRYYKSRYGIVSINPQNKTLKKIMTEINETAKLKLDWKKNMGWGKLFLINKSQIKIALASNKLEQIAEMKLYINSEIKKE